VYEVGKDISQATFDHLGVAVADWFRSWRPDHKEPAADARLRIKCCLEGKTLNGASWYSHWNSSFATRMRMLARFDVDKMQGITTGDPVKKASKQKAKAKEMRERTEKAGTRDKYIPDITRKELDGRIHYGDKAMPITEAEQKLWREYRDAYLAEFPELRTVNARGELSSLCDLQIVHERNRLKLLNGDRIEAQEMLETTKLITELKKALNIHPEQVAKRVKAEEGGSIAEAAARFEALPKEVRDRFLAEELLILYQQYMQPSPREDSGGYQLDEVGLFGATRCRTCHCSKCGQRNYAGFSIDEVETHLVARGWLVPENPVDTHIAAAVVPAPDVSGTPAPDVSGTPAPELPEAGDSQ
jgi:hypothetical protein